MAAVTKKKMTILLLGLVLVSAACLAAYFFFMSRANPPLTAAQVKVGNAVFSVEIASTSMELTRGLSYRAGLDEGKGMLFLFGQPAIQHFWMKDMNFPIDIIWIGGGRVLGFAENAQPQPGVPLWSLAVYNSPDGTDKVLEVNAGAVSKDGIKAGDPVIIGEDK